MPRAATETFAASSNGTRPPGRHPRRRCERTPAHPLLLAKRFAWMIGAVVLATASLPLLAGDARAQSSEDPINPPSDPPPLTPVESDNPVPFPRAIELAPAEYGPAPPRRLAQLGTMPNWDRLDAYQGTMVREEFERLLSGVYAADDQAWREHIQILPDRTRIRLQSNWPAGGWYELLFRPDDSRDPLSIERYWTPPHQLRPRIVPGKPLADLHILVDPGHIGGEFARTEGRWYQIGAENQPVMEGEMSLRVARILERDLTLLGARVTLSRSHNAPVTPLRPPDLMKASREWYVRRSSTTNPFLPRAQVETLAYKLFYLSSEIRTRAAIINDRVRPDLALCLHFNAESWGNPRRPRFKRNNHFHILVNGCYSAGEIAEDDQRLEMLLRLLQRVHYHETAMADEIAHSMADEMRLDIFSYHTPNARKVGEHPAVWARDLLASRKFLCPVVFFEPYVMNNREVHDRVQEGEYRGLREFNGVFKKNLYQEYADSISAGLVNYYRRVRR